MTSSKLSVWGDQVNNNEVLFGVEGELLEEDPGFMRLNIRDLGESGLAMTIRVPLRSDALSLVATLGEVLPGQVEDAFFELKDRLD